jgi:hypothetical protein
LEKIIENVNGSVVTNGGTAALKTTITAYFHTVGKYCCSTLRLRVCYEQEQRTSLNSKARDAIKSDRLGRPWTSKSLTNIQLGNRS